MERDLQAHFNNLQTQVEADANLRLEDVKKDQEIYYQEKENQLTGALNEKENACAKISSPGNAPTL